MYYEGREGYIYTMLTKLIAIKHGSFGGPGLETDDLYASGSDDFRGYVWKIPPLSVLKDQRKVFSVNEWENYQPPITEVGELINFFFFGVRKC
jgi:hypothetical protein